MSESEARELLARAMADLPGAPPSMLMSYARLLYAQRGKQPLKRIGRVAAK